MARSDKLEAPVPERFHEALLERLSYDHETGLFRFRKNQKVAGCLCKDTGYIRIRLWNKLHLAHRLAWFYTHGRWPADEIDHRNGKRDDNRIENLREATKPQNSSNKGKARKNKSGVKGVCYDKSRDQWRATIQVEGKWRQLGRHPTKEAAAAAYAAAAKKLQGEFFPVNLPPSSTGHHVD